MDYEISLYSIHLNYVNFTNSVEVDYILLLFIIETLKTTVFGLTINFTLCSLMFIYIICRKNCYNTIHISMLNNKNKGK